MNTLRNLMFAGVVVSLATFIGAWLSAESRAQIAAQAPAASIAGVWTLNKDLSDEPPSERRDDDSAGRRRGGYGRGGSTGGGYGRGGGMGRGGFGGGSGRDPEAAQRLHPNDRVRIVRAIEIVTRHGKRDPGAEAIGDWRRDVAAWRLLMVGLHQSREALRRRLAERARGMVARGMMEEVRRLLEAGYDESLPAMAGIGYRQFAAVVRGRLTGEEALRLMIRDTVRYAKRQMTWFARDPEIRWIDVDAAGGVDGAAESILKLITREGLIE